MGIMEIGLIIGDKFVTEGLFVVNLLGRSSGGYAGLPLLGFMATVELLES